MLVVTSARGIRRLSFDAVPGRSIVAGGHDAEALADRALLAIEGNDICAVPLDPVGTSFQQAVWSQVLLIPRGETRTYRDIATALGRPAAARAVGSANAANPIVVLIPCHRLLRGDGGLGGYAYGLARKRALLDREQACPAATARLSAGAVPAAPQRGGPSFV